jgi:hypothetical protein
MTRNVRSNNGGLLLGQIQVLYLSILNTSDLCDGIITRHRKTITSEENSVIVYIIVCDFLLNYLEQMLIDEPRTHVLTKYGKTRKTEIDHNISYAKFAISYSSRVAKTKREIFNFRNEECQKKFFEVTDNNSSATKNAKTLNDHLTQFKTPEGSFSQTGFLKVKRKLLPRKTMAKKDA